MNSLDNRRVSNNEIVIDASVDNLYHAMSFIDSIIEKTGCPGKLRTEIEIAAEEIFINIAHYAYTPDTGKVKIGVAFSSDPLTAEITFTDRGVQYDPLSREDPDITLPVEERPIGGLGIFLVISLMDDVKYEYKDGHNILKLYKKLEK